MKKVRILKILSKLLAMETQIKQVSNALLSLTVTMTLYRYKFYLILNNTSNLCQMLAKSTEIVSKNYRKFESSQKFKTQ